MYTWHPTHYTFLSTPYTLMSTRYTLHLTLHTLHFTLHTLRFTLHTLRFTLNTWHPTLYTWHSTLGLSTFCTLHFTLHTMLCLHTARSMLHTLHFAFYAPHSTKNDRSLARNISFEVATCPFLEKIVRFIRELSEVLLLMRFDICTINVRVSIRVRLHFVLVASTVTFSKLVRYQSLRWS